VQDVAPDLVAPAGLDVLAAELAQLASFSSSARSSRRALRTLIAVSLFWVWTARSGSGDDAGRQVGQPTARIGLVDVLAAGALRRKRVDPDLVPVELDLDVLVDLGRPRRGRTSSGAGSANRTG
jgi:hypothetical protein